MAESEEATNPTPEEPKLEESKPTPAPAASQEDEKVPAPKSQEAEKTPAPKSQESEKAPAAKSQEAEIQRGLSLGAAGYVTKPFDALTLGQHVRDIVSRIAP